MDILTTIIPFDTSKWDWSSLLHPHEFRWQVGITPMSNLEVILISWIVYAAIILPIRFYYSYNPTTTTTTATAKKAKSNTTTDPLTMFSAIHNLILCIWSLIMFIYCVLDVIERSQTRGLAEIFCTIDPSPSSLTGRLFYITYIYYLSKFYELIDTVILALKNKRIIFLHWYHHCIVILMVWTWLSDPNMYASLGMMFNTLIHVFMYYYYFRTALGHSVWFKRYITSGQIIQFMTSFILSIPYLYYHFTRGCPVGFATFLFSMFCNGTFLVLFIRFYKNTYKGAGGANAKDMKKKKN